MTEIKIQENIQTNFPHPISIRLACVEDGLYNIGFRKFAAFVKSIHANTKIIYVTTGNVRGFIKIMSEKGAGALTEKDTHKVAQFMAEGDIAAFSSMTHNSLNSMHQLDRTSRKRATMASQMVNRAPYRYQDDPKTGPKPPKMSPKWNPNGPKIGPRGPQEGPRGVIWGLGDDFGIKNIQNSSTFTKTWIQEG